jgi:predicted extracellular nuclease
MPPVRPGRRSPSARRQLLAVVTAAFIILQPVLFGVPRASAQVTPSLGVPYTQNFDTLPASGSATWTNNSTIPGWFHARTGTGTTIVANNGSSNAGNLYSYGCTDAVAPCNVTPNATTDRALGSLGSGNAGIGNLFWGVRLQNNTGSTITQLDISYTGEQWRNSAAAAQTVAFSYLVGSPTVTGSLAEFQSAGVAVPQLDFTSPVTGGSAGQLNGNLAANRVTLTHSITGLSIPSGTEIMLRWSDPDHSGADHGLSIDDFSVTATGTAPVDNPPTVASTSPADNASNVPLNSNVSVTFSEPVNATASSFQISCATSGAHAFGLSGGPTTYTLDPTADFSAGEVCTVTVVGAQVTDQDGTPNQMAADFVFDFTTTGAPPRPIHDVQGSTPSGDGPSPRAGETLTTTGVVTLLRTGTNTGGAANSFFIQTPDGAVDADPNTSQGLLIFTNAVPVYTATGVPVAVGDEVTVTGTVSEFFGMTEITSVTNISAIDTGNPLPTAVTLTTTILDPTASPAQPQLEKFEGMRMGAASLRTVAPNDNFYEVETVLGSVARPMREPGIEISTPTVPPDPGEAAPDCCIPRWDENPERLKVDTNGRAGSPLNPYTSNVTFSDIAGPLDFSFGEYKLIPEATPTATGQMSAVPVPTPTANEFTVAGYNIENFNNNATQRQKAALAIRDVMRLPHIIGTAEIFDLEDLQALAVEVNSIAPGSNYVARLEESDNSASGDNDQDVGFLVDTSRVNINSVTQMEQPGCNGTPATCNTFTDPTTGQPALLNDRPPLVLSANVQPSGANLPVIVVVNHMRSFICIDADADPAVAAGCDGGAADGPRVRAKRKAQGEFLADLLQDLQTANPTTPVISVGDYNAYQFSDGFTDPIATVKGNPTPDNQLAVDASPDLVNPDFVNLVDGLAPAERYSFVFEGTPQALDHVIINTVARSRNTRFQIARNNADFPETPAATFLNNAARPERNSDHDMPVAYFSLNAAAAAGSLVISEFRFRGPGPDLVEASPEVTEVGGGFGGFDLGGFGGSDALSFGGPAATFNPQAPNAVADTSPQANDEFIEFYNNTDSDIFVAATDGSAGWALVAADGQVRFVIPSGTTIPARSHYLAVNNLGYSLSGYRGGLSEVGATGTVGDSLLDANGSGIGGYTLDIPDNSGVALFRTANPANFNMTERLDAAGYAGVPELYREGAGFPTGGAETSGDLQYAFFRDYRPTGRPKDTGNNAADFLSADTAGTPGLGLGQRLGAPGPENSTSPVERSADFSVTTLNPAVSSTAVPNRVRKLCGVAEECDPNRSQFGTMSIRRTVTNNTGGAVAQLRFRVVEVTTFPQPNAATADIRAIDSDDIQVTVNGQPVEVRGTTVEQPPDQPRGGGWNTSLNVGFVTLDQPLAAGDSVSVQFLLGIQQTGNFKFFLNIEALPDPNVVLGPASRTRR